MPDEPNFSTAFHLCTFQMFQNKHFFHSAVGDAAHFKAHRLVRNHSPARQLPVQKPFIIALHGNMGAGKSLICKVTSFSPPPFALAANCFARPS